MRDVVAVRPAIVAVTGHVRGAFPLRFGRVGVSGASGLPRTVVVRLLALVTLLMATVLTALPHCPGVAIRGVLLSSVVAMVTPVTLLFELAVTPLLPVVVLMLRAAAAATRFGWVELVLRGRLLDVVVAQVLLGVVVHVEALLLPQVEHAHQTQQQDKEQGSAHGPTHYGAQVTLGDGLQCWEAEQHVALLVY